MSSPRSSRILYIFLVVLLLVNIVLVGLYVIKLRSKNVSTPKKELSAIEIIPGDLDKGSLDEAEIIVKISKVPQETKMGGLSMSTETQNESLKRLIRVDLGNESDKFLLNEEDETVWKRTEVKNIVSQLKKDSQIRLRFYIQDPTPILNDPLCKKQCQEDLKKAQKYIENNNKLVDMIKNKESSKQIMTIGAITAISFNLK